MTVNVPTNGSRERILNAAAEIAAESGYEGTTISKVTRRSGLPASSVYWHFKDKDDLLAAVVEHSFEVWLAAQPSWEPLPPGVTIAEGLRKLLSRSVRSLPAAPDFLRIGQMLTLERREHEPAARTLFLKIRDQVEDDITGWFAEELGGAHLEERPDLPRELARLIIAATDGLFLSYQIHDIWDPDEYVALIVDAVDAAVSTAS